MFFFNCFNIGTVLRCHCPQECHPQEAGIVFLLISRCQNTTDCLSRLRRGRTFFFSWFRHSLHMCIVFFDIPRDGGDVAGRTYLGKYLFVFYASYMYLSTTRRNLGKGEEVPR
jgi:hypothetical protein